MVEFLIDNTPELKNPSEELTALAEQIRTVLEKFSPSDPAVTIHHRRNEQVDSIVDETGDGAVSSQAE